VPAAYRFTPRGSFVLAFGAPLDVPGPLSNHDERVDSLVGQYASFLRDEWRLYPSNIPWNHLLYYCQLPLADAGAPAEKAGRSGITATAEPVSGMQTGAA